MASQSLYPLFTKGINKHFLLRLMHWDPVWRRIFHMNTTGDRYIWAQGWQGYTLPVFRIPGEQVAQASFQPSFSKQYIIRNYGLGDSVAQEDIDDDLYAVINFVLAQKGGYMALAFTNLLEYQTAAFFMNQGFASGTTVAGMADGRSLFNTAHPIAASNLGKTVGNRPSTEADLSQASIQVAHTNLWQQKAPDDLTFLNNAPRLLVINPQLHYVAEQLTRGKWQQNSADRNENFVRNDNVQVVEWPYFTKSGATGTNNAWFEVGQTHFLEFYMRSAPKTRTDYDVNTNSQIFNTHCRFDLGADDWRGVYGSLGV